MKFNKITHLNHQKIFYKISAYYNHLPNQIPLNSPHSFVVQEMTPRHTKRCEICKKIPVRKRLAVIYKSQNDFSSGEIFKSKIYCIDCANDFLRDYFKNINVAILETRVELGI